MGGIILKLDVPNVICKMRSKSSWTGQVEHKLDMLELCVLGNAEDHLL